MNFGEMGPEDLGRATVEPSGSFPVGYTGTWRIKYTAGRFGMDDQSCLLVVQRDMTDAAPLQSEDPEAPGYIRARTDGEAKLKVSYDPWRWVRPWRGAIVVTVYDGFLAPGEKIEVVLERWTLQTFPETRHEFRVLVDPFGTREFRPLPEHPSIRIVPAGPFRLEGVLPSVARPGEEVEVWARVVDRWGNPVEEFRGEVKVECPGAEGLPASSVLEGGVGTLGKVRFPREGTYRLRLSCGRLEGMSNPVHISWDPKPIFWADLHGQTQDTIGTGTLKEYFSFARDKALVDVVSWQGNDFQITEDTWKEVRRLTAEFHEPGRFVTFLGYEWSGLTPAGGDHNVLFLGEDQVLHRSSSWQVGGAKETDRYPISRLWEEFRGRRDVMAVAHVGGRYANLDFWDPEICRLVEVHSAHGTFEWLAEDAIRRGLVVGFVAGSDDHTGRPGLSSPLRRLTRGSHIFDAYGGLTGIYAEELSRNAIWEALRSRHCYATTGARMVLDLRCGEHIMGDVVEGPPAGMEVGVVGTAPLLDVEVLRDGDVVYRHPLGSSTDWVRADWSGVRAKSREKRADWSGEVEVLGGRIEDFRTFGFKREGEGIFRESDRRLRVVSTTSGDTVGTFLRVSGERPVVKFRCGNVDVEVPVRELGREPSEFPAGGVNLKLRLRLSSPEGRPEEVWFTFCDPDPPPGPHAYWVRVLQADGHMAWSSPIFFR